MNILTYLAFLGKIQGLHIYILVKYFKITRCLLILLKSTCQRADSKTKGVRLDNRGHMTDFCLISKC